MTAAISGGLGLIGGLFGMSQKPAGPGIAPQMYIMAGQEQQGAARGEAQMLGREAAFSYEQGLLEAAQTEYKMRSIKEQQALKFSSQGITLGGSPLGVLQETESLGMQEANAQRRRGTELSGLYEMQGLQMLRQGSAAAFSGFAQSLQSQWDAKVQASQQKAQNFQTGIAGLRAGVEGFGSMFKSKGTP